MASKVVGRLGEASNPKVHAKLQQLLQAAVQGVLANDSVSPSDLLLFIHGILEAGIAAEEAAQAAVQAAAEAPGDCLTLKLPRQHRVAAVSLSAQQDFPGGGMAYSVELAEGS